MILAVGAAGLFRFAMAGPVSEAPLAAPPAVPAPALAAPVVSAPPPPEAAPTTPSTTVAPVAAPKAVPPAPPPAAKPKPAPAAKAAASSRVTATAPITAASTIAPYRGLGTWLDVYDWSATYTNGNPGAGPDDVDAMVAAGVQTLYIQTARGDTPEDVLEPDRLHAIIDRAHAAHLAVVAWFLPYLTDPAADLRHLEAAAHLGVEGVGVDIESRSVSDVGDRNQRLVDLSAALRTAAPGTALAAIVLPPVVLEVVNTNYWPDFPWRQIAPFYDVWMPMDYWTGRTEASGYRDAYRYTSENVARMRADLGLPAALTHPIGGIGDRTTTADDDAFLRAVVDTASIGGSIYDWRTTAAEEWPHLHGLRA
jgi:hypothetical protein